jgi:Ca2+:H+ antiporter
LPHPAADAPDFGGPQKLIVNTKVHGGRRTTISSDREAKPQAATGTIGVVETIRAELPLLAGAATAAFFYTVGSNLASDFSNLWLSGALGIWLFAVMVWSAFGVVHHAEALAQRLGEPYGTLILTISVISIEVAIMASVMLAGNPNPTLPRDTMMAVLMIVLNAMVGVSILVGAVRYFQQEYNLQGAVAYLATLSVLAVISLVVPSFTTSTPDHSMTFLQGIVFASSTVLLYGAFLVIQTVRHRAFFLEPTRSDIVAKQDSDDRSLGPTHSLSYHAVFLILTLLPLVMLSKPLAKLLDYGIEQLGAPTALGGIVIALLVLSPEGLSSFQAAARNQLQRSVNLSLGSALATIGLTIPAMLTISLVTGTPLELGLSPVEIVLLVSTLFVANMTLSGVPTNVLLGLLHVVLFLVFLVLVFNP